MWKMLTVLLLSICFPVHEALEDVCFPHAVMDLVFLVDGSGSVSAEEFSKIKSFLRDFVDFFHIGRQQVRIGLTQYSSDVKAEFTLGTFNSTKEMKLQIKMMRQLTGGTLTGQSLEFLLTHQFTEAAGSRASGGVPQVVVLITDGESQDDVTGPAEVLKKHGITLYCIGVQHSVSAEEMLSIASNKEYTSILPKFSDLQESTKYISQTLCELAENPKLQGHRVCQQGASADIIFLVDGSYPISPTEFKWIKDFVYVLMHRFYIGLDQVRFGLVQYSDTPRKEFNFNTYQRIHKENLWDQFSTYQHKSKLHRHIWDMKQINGNKTMTGLGLDFLLNHQFNEFAGSRISDGVPQIGVLITGHRSTDTVKEKAEELKRKGITLYAIGGRDAAVEELREIVSKPENMYFVSNFSNLHDITENIIQSLCDTAEERGKLIVHLPPDLYNLTADSQITVQRGRSLTIQCHYDDEYRDHVKYWCRMRTQSSCTTIVSTDTPERRGKVSITDDSTHHVFYVTMSDLQTMDSDVYWCAVETNNTEIYMAFLNLTVTAGAVGLSVFNNKLTGKTGENVSIQSFYSEGNGDQEKKWCRRGDWSSCLTAGGNRTSQERVQLDIDDRHRIFTVTVRGLESNDTGWYWITAGDQLLPVHINVRSGNGTKKRHQNRKVSIPDRKKPFCFPLKLTLQRSDTQSLSPFTVEEALHQLLHIVTVLLYIICTLVAASKICDYRCSPFGAQGGAEMNKSPQVSVKKVSQRWEEDSLDIQVTFI